MWQARNELVFQQKRMSACHLVQRIQGQVLAILQSLEDNKKIAPQIVNQAIDKGIHWRPPDSGWYKLNCDGSVTNYGGKAGCGGVLRGEMGEFLFGYAAGLGPSSITEAELMAILRGMQIARERGFEKILVETDSLAVVSLLKRECLPLHPSFNIIQDIKSLLLQRDSQAHHIFRESNQVADGFAKHGLDMEQICCIFESSPPFVSLALRADSAGVVLPRF